MAKTKKEALAIVFAAADAYQKNLIDHSLLFLCMDKHKRTYRHGRLEAGSHAESLPKEPVSQYAWNV